MSLLIRWALGGVVFWLIAHYVPGISIASWKRALLLSLFWGLLGFTIKPIWVILTLPINLITFGLFTLVIIGFLFWLLGGIIKGFEVDTFLHAFLGALLLALLMGLINWFLDRSDD
ncbi:MAG: phage holin family protein [Candidatus Moraniibacteriota bacterium]|nr:MAG: phage holin family protein [Candidatus Moranbacteria bacterium]